MGGLDRGRADLWDDAEPGALDREALALSAGGAAEDRLLVGPGALDPGDLLILYTDGLTEARDPHGQIFGLDRVTALVEAHAARSVTEIRDQILAAVAAWAGPEPEDDRTLMVLRHLGLADPPGPGPTGAPPNRP